ncbi:MAG: glycosyltransferase family 2 protein [Anaerolineae bacterium]
MSEEPYLSIVIPAYNEELRLPASLREVVAFVKTQPYTIEVIVVDNNSTDQTGQIARAFAEANPFLHAIHEPRQGKGAAIRTGMLAARGQYRFICDADLSMPIEEVNKFLPPALDGYDVAIGSREVPGAVRYDEPWYRHLMGRVFNTIVRLLAVPGFHDTQCGFKMFTAAATEELFPLQTMDGWSFDVELLHAAQRRGLHIVEVPINWYYRESSRIHPVRDSINMFREVLKIRANSRRGLYDRR